MPRFLTFFIAVAASMNFGSAETHPNIRIQPLCGNVDNGIVVGKPRLYDDRTIALNMEAIEARLTGLKAQHTQKISDVLPEETQLTWELLNLRSLSDRALSDRVLLRGREENTGPAKRARALLGFSLSVDGKDRYPNAVAEVEVTVSSRGEAQEAPALTALLPREHTYNIASISRRTEATGGEVQTLTTVGNETVFLVKDTDTVALEKVRPVPEGVKGCSTGFHPGPRDLTFAWRFVPVLGRDQVDSGTREVYAMLALPGALDEDYTADLHIHTHWRALKKPKRKSIDYIEETARDEFWPAAIHVNTTEMELALRPRVTGVRFLVAGEKVKVFVDGENFLPDTMVSLGGTTFFGEGLKIDRERHLEFEASAKELVDSDLYLTGRFGSPVPVLEPLAASRDWTGDPAWGLKIEYARARPKDAERSEVRIKLKSRERKKPLAETIVNSTLIEVGGKTFQVRTLETEPTDSDAELIRFDVPTAALRKFPEVTVARLFGGAAFRDSAELVLEDDISAREVSVLASTGDDVTLAIAGSGFSSLAVVQIAGVTYTRWTKPELLITGASMITLKVKRDLLQGARHLTVSQGFAQPVILPVPEVAPPEASRTKAHRRR